MKLKDTRIMLSQLRAFCPEKTFEISRLRFELDSAEYNGIIEYDYTPQGKNPGNALISCCKIRSQGRPSRRTHTWESSLSSTRITESEAMKAQYRAGYDPSLYDFYAFECREENGCFRATWTSKAI